MPSLKKMYEKFDQRVHVLSREMGAKSSAKHYFKLFENNGVAVRHLTKEQKEQVNAAWNGHVKENGFATHELVLTATGRFDPLICSEMLFRTNIELALNNFQLKYGFSEKNYFDAMFPDVPMPVTLIRNVNGVNLDGSYRPVDADRVKAILADHDKVIVKPSIENGCGRAVKLFTRDEYDRIDGEFKKDYLIQEVFRQHASVAALNPSSVNVVRVVSLSLNGRVSPVNYALRCGATGAVTDNSITKDGRGMFVIGVQPDGVLKDEAYYSCGEKITVAPNGQQFAGIKLPNFPKALEMTTMMHEKLPHFGFIAFDVCFDEAGNPVIMEYNLRGPGVLYYQYANGPLFGERTQEVIDTFCCQ